MATRAGSAERARVAIVLLLTLRGTPTVYYGEELGMTDVEVPPDRLQDPWALREPGQGRDGARTPMPWETGPNGGFTLPSAEPWLPMGPMSATAPVAAQLEDPASTLNLTRKLLALRRGEPALHRGSFSALDGVPAGCFAYLRSHPGADTHLIALNLSGNRIDLSGIGSGQIVLAAGSDRSGERVGRSLSLDPDDGVVIRRD
jgi:alpha-glucosidase